MDLECGVSVSQDFESGFSSQHRRLGLIRVCRRGSEPPGNCFDPPSTGSPACFDLQKNVCLIGPINCKLENYTI